MIDNKPKTKKIYSKESARIMNKLLMRVTDSGTAKSITLCDIIDTAGKTGTSGNDMDRLFVGYTPYYTAGIWCGYNGERKSIGKQNISHLQIWDEVMKEIHEYRLEFNENVEGFSTEGLEYLPYCRDSGELYCDNCMLDPRKSRLEYGYFTYDNKPKKLCDRHVICLYDKSIKDVASEESPKEELILISLLDIPERKIPTDIAVKDAKYVLQADADSLMKRGSYYDIPYFINTLNEGKFAKKGKGRR